MDKTEKPDTLGDVATATVNEVRDAAVEQYENLERSIRRNPLQAVAIAAG
jgi:hypothetical protein